MIKHNMMIRRYIDCGEKNSPETQEKVTDRSQLEDLTVKELKELAVEDKIAGYSNMTKTELIEALKND